MKTHERVRAPGRVPVQKPIIPPQRMMAVTNGAVRFLGEHL